MKNVLLVCMFSLVIVASGFSLGSKDTIDTPAENMDSWLETVDISERKPGKYNILITAEDLAGNQGFAGPFNMYIDPDSDLPVTQITNPLNGMRVPGNLNIVGTCVDDDAVEYVEIVLDGMEAPIRAEGKEFWSYYLDTTKMSEGAHIISVYGVDINGVRGRPHTVSWHLDRNRPESQVTNIGMGALVSKKFLLSGIVTDGNGIKELYYSLDNGKTFLEVPIKHDKDEGVWRFSVDIESREMPDGPAVCWFKAIDGQGSEGFYTFLYFIDNTPPEVGVISPRPEEPVNGVFSVSGYAQDILGIEKLSWTFGKETGDFEVVRGNPYWVKEFNLTGVNTKGEDVIITATDTAGNVTNLKYRILVDQTLDIPSLEILTPEAGAAVGESVIVSGLAKDDDGIADVWYSLNGGDAQQLTVPGSFGIEITDLPAGNHTVTAWPVDINGVKGPESSVSFSAMGKEPVITIDPVTEPLTEIHPEAGYVLKAQVESDSGLGELSWRLTGRDTQTVEIKNGTREQTITVPIGLDTPYGLMSFEVVATDIHGRETKSVQNFYLTNLSIPRDAPPDISSELLRVTGEVTIAGTSKIPPSTGTASLAIEKLVRDDKVFENGTIVSLSGPGAPREEQLPEQVLVTVESPVPLTALGWSINGGELKNERAKKIDDTYYEALLVLDPKLPADWTVIDVTATFKDESTLNAKGYVCVVRPEPEAGIFDDEQFVWGTALRSPDDKILLYDGATLTGLYNGKPDLVADSVRFGKNGSGLQADVSGNEITITGTAEGEYAGVTLVITDSDGGTFTTAPVTIVVDSAPPEITFNDFERPIWLQNNLKVSGTASDSHGVFSVEYSLDNGLSWEPFDGARFSRTLDISHLADGNVLLLARAIDKSGRTTTAWHLFTKDTEAPVVETLLPEAGDVVNGETLIGFRYDDATGVSSVEYRAPGDRTARDQTVYVPVEQSSLTNTFVGTFEKPIADAMEFRFTDAAGNQNVVNSWLFTIDAQADKPVVEIHLPEENEVIRKDFVISGVVYDDDKPAKIWYKIDDGQFTEVPIEHSYSIPVALLSLTDNEHTITMYAEDIHGVRGDEVVRNIRVSLEEPKAAVVEPSFETTNRNIIDITGVASDKNGIDRVEVSLDNGNSFNLAEGAESWSYRFDTRVIQDGTHVVFIRVFDKYETVGLYSSLINIDNTAPSIRLELPVDGSKTGETLFISGQTMDNIKLTDVRGKISNINPNQPAIPAGLRDIQFDNELIITYGIDITSLPEGFYNMEVSGYDRAGNVTRVSRNFEVYRKPDRNRIEFLYPMNGEHVQGMFKLYGRVVSEDPVESLLLYIDDEHAATAEMTHSGYYEFTVTPELMADGEHKLNVQAIAKGDKIIRSEDRTVIYQPSGPWVVIDNLVMGDFAVDRPWLMGTAGYAFTEEEVLALESKETPKEEKRRLENKTVESVEISFDNGKSFQRTESGKKWRYRLETGDLREGYHFMLVRAKMQTGEVAVTRTIIQIDKTAPTIRLISPGEGGRYNNELVFSGLSSDDIELDSVMLSLRPGDKSRYAIPAFIQGLYFDWHFWGATLYDVGMGLTFFDDNVKLQVQFGQFTKEQREVFTSSAMRYGGNVFGLKLLANVVYLPLDYFFGPDFYWLSATAAIGANFSMFSETQSGQPQILSAILLQLEFPRVTLPKRKTFRTFSLYTEGQFWFISTDIDSSEVNIDSILPHITGGIRMNIF